MANETVITIIGNLTADPELRFTQSGIPVASFTIASNPRTFDRQTGEWKDGEALFMRCSIWRAAAENVASSLKSGMRVVAQGKLRQRTFDAKEGGKRTVIELEVEEIGPSLRYASATVTRNSADNPPGAPVNTPAAPAEQNPWDMPPVAADPWEVPMASPARPALASVGAGAVEPPF
ncbi:single-stranded DNA-binding protein [Crossiella sp. SN42]|uniref:single-stranded DNA-binding protein n=1 Tax=Crossiella sp. SN42 TaxID=2944808 RepID=UPI00207D3211|nr:single-stranded DNA-binding protein [Crossiella sp. SN42]MCO1575600.1 single-stranded DNA-binding protein [Crossiella sp. SN42]